MCDGTVHFVGGKKGKIENLWNGKCMEMHHVQQKIKGWEILGC